MTPEQANESERRYLTLDHESGYHDGKPRDNCPVCERTTSIGIDERRDTSESMVETVSVQRGRIIIEVWPWGDVDWVASDTAGKFVAAGSAGCRAYAITDANIALIRATGPTAAPVRFPALCDWCDDAATWKAVRSYTNPYDGSPTTWTTRYCNLHVAGHTASEGPLERLSADACCVVLAADAADAWRTMVPSGYVDPRRGDVR